MNRSPFLFLIVFLLGFSCSVPNCRQQVLLYIALDGEGNFNIYKNDLAGQETQLTDNPSWDYAPAWNPTTRTFTYYAYVEGDFKILQKNLNGNNVPLDTDLTEYNVSPNNQSAISEVSVGETRKLVLTDLQGQQPLDITPDSSYNGRAKWSPDSKKIAYISDRDGNNEVYLYNLATQETSRLTINTTSEKYLSWAPDSRRLLYSTEYYEEGQPDRNDLFVIDIATGDVNQLTDNPYEDSEVAWSPLGDLIAFHSKRDSIDHIFLMDADGTNVRQLTLANKYQGEPNWGLVSLSLKRKISARSATARLQTA